MLPLGSGNPACKSRVGEGFGSDDLVRRAWPGGRSVLVPPQPKSAKEWQNR